MPARLPPHETVFATTVHKSQGSEFTSVALVLPAEVSPILSRDITELALLSPLVKTTESGGFSVAGQKSFRFLLVDLCCLQVVATQHVQVGAAESSSTPPAKTS